jgi:hypothetical protein
MFWGLPIIPYAEPVEGVIEKQMKLQSKSAEEVAEIERLLQQYEYSSSHVMVHSDTPTEFKDIRKVTIGLSKKALRAHRPKIKGAFYNCFVTIVRIRLEAGFREFHVKVFNTGKVEIPGIQSDDHLRQVVEVLTASMNRVMYITAVPHSEEIVLINSNFNCGYYIDRDKLFNLLKYKYRMNCNYDSCSYPGIQSKFYYIPGKEHSEQNGQQPVSMDMPYYEVSFMIFRTGSILSVGKWNEEILNVIYRYICSILENEFSVIQMGLIPSAAEDVAVATRNTRKKKIVITDIKIYHEME